MKEKKQAKDWYIAATHWLTAGFVMPVLVGFVAAFVVIPLLNVRSEILISIVLLGFRVFAVWLGVIYSARYLEKKYIQYSKNKVVKLATVYLIIANFAFFLISLIQMEETNAEVILGNLAGHVILFILFYLFSNKYIKEIRENLVN